MLEVDLLAKPLTAAYDPVGSMLGPRHTSLNRYPPFSTMYVNAMLVDPRVRFGLELIKAPILTKGQFEVNADNPAVAEYVKETLDTYKLFGQQQSLRSLEFGYACAEPMYEVRKGAVFYKELKPLYPTDCKAIQSVATGNLAGAVVKVNGSRNGMGSVDGQIVLGGPKCLWSVHNRDYHPWYGLSRLFGAFLPWLEKWNDGGFRDIRRLGYYKQAYDGGTMEHPPGETLLQTAGDGTPITKPNRDLAREIMDNKRTGGSLILPRVIGQDGQNLWRYTPGTNGLDMSGINAYGKDLDDEIWEGMGIPAEVAKAPGDSSGSYGGRSVPQEAFMGITHSVFCENTTDFVKQIIHPLVVLRFGRKNSWFQVKPYGLLTEASQMDGAADATVEPNGAGQDFSGKGKQPQGAAMSHTIPISNAVKYNSSRANYAIHGGGDISYA
tara:strand:+ start:655 stop:1968 length:1314 start_codon:yes stop_codon:yes gene_type:complete